jgi:hypothetical protein
MLPAATPAGSRQLGAGGAAGSTAPEETVTADIEDAPGEKKKAP